jgi:uncharacterized peroxidase-related enzyme
MMLPLESLGFQRFSVQRTIDKAFARGKGIMTFIRTVPVEEATGQVKTMYQKARESIGEVPNYIMAFSQRPEVWDAGSRLFDAVRGNMDLRRYELITVAVALALESSYCALSHGKVLSDKFLGPEQTEAFARDFRRTALTPAEKAMAAFAQKIALSARNITQEDVDELRRQGFSDQEIFDIAAAAAARCFMSKLLDATGAQADASYGALEPGLRQALTVGRDIDPATRT